MTFIKTLKQYLVEAYETRVAVKEKKKLMAPLPISEDLKVTVSSPRRDWGASWLQQYSILFWRGLKERRHDYLSWMRITQVIATAVILGLLWWHSDSTTLKGLQDQVKKPFPSCTIEIVIPDRLTSRNSLCITACSSVYHRLLLI